MSAAPVHVVAGPGTTQTLAWASTYYLPAMLATPIARDLGVSASTVFATFSTALILSALLGPRAGRATDRRGGCPILISTSLVFALGLGLLGFSRGVACLFGAWLVIGVGMGTSLYEATFSTLVRPYGRDARGAYYRHRRLLSRLRRVAPRTASSRRRRTLPGLSPLAIAQAYSRRARRSADARPKKSGLRRQLPHVSPPTDRSPKIRYRDPRS